MRWLGWMTALLAPATGLLSAQTVIAAKSGLVHYYRGEVYLDQTPLEGGGAHLRLVKPGQEFRTGRGRAEFILHPGVLPYLDRAFVPTLAGGDSPVLKPGAALRLGDHGAMRMLDNSLEAARVEIAKGSAILDLGELPKNTNISVKLGSTTVVVSKAGMYRFDAENARVSTYKGEARVTAGGRETRLPAGFRIADGQDKPARFDTGESDALVRWSRWRAHVTSQANLAALKRAIPATPHPRRRLRQ